jgi:4-aminobutyrate aminotransferase/(S)-3-amino-2-methylpropionate transaminase
MTTNHELNERRRKAIPRGLGQTLDVYAARARNAEIWDVEDRRYIDFASGIAVLNTGHLHPKIQAAVAKQLEHFSHACFQVTPYESYVTLAEELNALLPGPGPNKTLLLTSGAEAVENAIKIARHHTGRSGVIAFNGGFHGRTLACMSLTGKVQPYKAGFGAMLPEVFHAPYPMPYHGVTTQDALAALQRLFKADIDPTRIAAMIVEPVLGEGGFYIAPAEFLQALRSICDQHGIVLIVDEIQTGFARTGRMFAIEYAGVSPDLMTVAKSLAGGLPLSAVVGRAAIMDSPTVGGLGGTYAGSPLGCAAALAVMQVIREENLCERAAKIGARLGERLHELRARFACIGEIRGLGAMMAMELVKNRNPDEPDADLTRALVQAAGRRGLVLLSCGVYANVIRFLMPLTIEDDRLIEGMELLTAALEDVTQS